jgi:hypothetical protein
MFDKYNAMLLLAAQVALKPSLWRRRRRRDGHRLSIESSRTK